MPTIKIVDVETNQEIEREMNETELIQWNLDKENVIAERLAKETLANAKSDLLAKLGITAEEAKLLLS